MHLEVETGYIPVNARVISQALRLLANGDSFPKLDPKKHRHLIEAFEGRTQKEAFLFASSNKYITTSFIPGVIDVRNPMRFFWGRHIYDCVKEGLRKYKEDGIRTIDGCMFALLILYLHTNKHGDLREYSGGVEPWTKEWTIAELREVVKEEQVRKSLQEEVVADCGAPSPVSNEKHHVVIASIKNHELQEEVVADCGAPSPVSNEEHYVVNESSVKECRTSKCLDMVVYFGPHESVNNMKSDEVIECMCALFNELPAKRFQEEFYCINPMILGRVMTPMNVEKFEDKYNSEYAGLAECWRNKIRLFNKVEAAKRHMFFVPIYLDNHWVKADEYAVKLIDELAQLTFSWYKVQDEGIGKPLYVDVPIQPNNYDCGVFVIKFMDSWDPETLDMDDYVVPVWTTKDMAIMRRKYLLDIVLDPWNGYLNTVEVVVHAPFTPCASKE
ncbi:uncharacterized protein DS421_11g324530 [Arachis hypogaea]|nr:uncharacterized protein DS421_11g324530 [Arachis hypogaea]